MRVISGTAKGHRLKGPPSNATRPMADKIREALFSSLASMGIEPDHVLDLYAGTGSIGIEALSRGASSVTFVDQAAAACKVISQNLRSTRFEDQGRVVRSTVERFIDRATDPYDFVVIDPPYADRDINSTLDRIAASRLVQSGTIIVLGHWPRFERDDDVSGLRLIKRTCHGDSCFSIFEVDRDQFEDAYQMETRAAHS